MKTQIVDTLKNNCKLLIEEQQEDQLFYIKIRANEEQLFEMADSIGYKLRLKKQIDSGEFSENCPAYCSFDKNYFRKELFEEFEEGMYMRQVDRIRLL